MARPAWDKRHGYQRSGGEREWQIKQVYEHTAILHLGRSAIYFTSQKLGVLSHLCARTSLEKGLWAFFGLPQIMKVVGLWSTVFPIAIQSSYYAKYAYYYIPPAYFKYFLEM